MRWLSSFAILFYLSFLCTPQAFAVNDARLSPLADSQFHAVNPSLHQHTLNTPQDKDDEPQYAILPAKRSAVFSLTALASVQISAAYYAEVVTSQQARAPPVFSLS